MAKKNEEGGKKRKTRKAAKPRNSNAKRRNSKARAEEEVIEPEDLEEVEADEDETDEHDARIEMEVDVDTDDDDGRVRIEFDVDGVFGRDGIFGDRGPFGPGGPFGESGPFGPKGIFGPGGVFAKSAKMSKGVHKMQRKMHRRSHGFSGGPRRQRMFRPGELRLLLLAMLAEEPRHGYELIKALEEMTEGAYSPSPGVIYPTLQMLADEGAIAAQDSDDAKKLYQATDAGIEELEDRKDEIEELWERLGRKTRRARPVDSPELFRSLGNLASVLTHKARRGELKGMDKEKIIDLIDELARKIERL